MGTFIFEVAGGAATLSGYSLAVGVELAEVLRALGAPVHVKWPNDLVVCNEGQLRKLGGILIEVQEHNGRRYVLVGIGINVLAPPQEVADIAGSVTGLRGAPISARELVVPLAEGLSRMHDRFTEAGGFGSFVDRWRELSCFRSGGSSIAVDLGQETIEGIYQDIDRSGALVLRVEGRDRLVHSGHLVRVEI
jgi:BirA family biotin operon repressor/biotin-[acetyl-CoA-carboxylase] ligase